MEDLDLEIRNLKLLLDVDEGFKIVTVPTRQSDYKRSKKLLITPAKTEWSFTLLSVFLNELNNWKMDEKNAHRNRSRSNKSSYSSFKLTSNENEKVFLLIKIENKKISIKGSKPYFEDWPNDEDVKESWIQKSSFIKFTNSASRALYRDSPLIFYPEKEFSPIFQKFASFFVSKQFTPLNADTRQIYGFYNKFLAREYYQKLDLEALIKNNEGYFFLELSTENDTGKKLDTILIENKKHFILSGTYFCPYIVSIIQDHQVNGLQLDTTWSVLEKYVTSCPTVIIKNVGIPLGFQFGLTEDTSIYLDFFKKFEETLGLRIQDYINTVQSDQGTSLLSAVEDLGMHHICCLRHLLVRLKKTKFSSQIGNLISCTCSKDFEDLKGQYNNSWKNLCENDLNELNKVLSKVGLAFKKKKIVVNDARRWEQVSMQKRAAFKMPSCTNQIESAHGHLNALVPRRNSFFSSIQRLIEETLYRTLNLETNFKNNYSRFKKKIKNIAKSTPDLVMKSMIADYGTDINEKVCHCGQSILMSSMMDIHLPCSHLYHIGEKFPSIQTPELDLKNTFLGNLVFEYKINTKPKIQINVDYYSKIRSYVYKMIKRSDCKFVN